MNFIFNFRIFKIFKELIYVILYQFSASYLRSQCLPTITTFVLITTLKKPCCAPHNTRREHLPADLPFGRLTARVSTLDKSPLHEAILFYFLNFIDIRVVPPGTVYFTVQQRTLPNTNTRGKRHGCVYFAGAILLELLLWYHDQRCTRLFPALLVLNHSEQPLVCFYRRCHNGIF